jgi:hypothetical protein
VSTSFGGFPPSPAVANPEPVSKKPAGMTLPVQQRYEIQEMLLDGRHR